MAALIASVRWSQGIQSGWEHVVTFVPKLVGFLVILLIGLLVAKLLAKVIDGILERVGFDRWVERGGIKTALAHSKYDASDLIAKVVYYAIILFVLQLAFGVFGPNPISDILRGIIAYLPRLFVAILIVVVAGAIAAAVKDLASAALSGLSYGRMLATGASVAIITIGIFAALSQLKIATPIVNGLFYAILAIVVGSAIVAIGGSGIIPLRRKWEEYLGRMEAEAPNIRREIQGAGERAKEQTEERTLDLREEPRADDMSRPGAERV
jgi:hypothetical protein